MNRVISKSPRGKDQKTQGELQRQEDVRKKKFAEGGNYSRYGRQCTYVKK